MLGRSVRDSFLLVRGTFSALRNRKFALFFWSQLMSAAGEWVQITAISILVLRLHGGGRELALVNLAAFVPLVLLIPVAGMYADVHDKTRLLAVSNSGLAATSITFGVLLQVHMLSLPLIYIIAFVSGCFGAFDLTVRQALVGDLVPQDNLANGVGLSVTSLTAARALGPFSAAILIPLVGLESSFYVNAATYVGLLAVLPWLRVARGDVAKRLPPRASLHAGLTVWRDRSLRIPLLQIAMLNGFGVTSTVLLPLFVIRTLHSTAGTYAVLAGIVGAGTVLGALSTATRTVVGLRPVGLCALGLAAMLAIVGSSSSASVAGLPLFLSGVLAACALATALSSMLVAAAPEQRGRTTAAYMTVFTASSAVVSPAKGFIAEATSPRIAYYVCAAVVAVSAVVSLSYRAFCDIRE